MGTRLNWCRSDVKIMGIGLNWCRFDENKTGGKHYVRLLCNLPVVRHYEHTLPEGMDAMRLPVMVMEPVRGGKLAGLTPEAEAIFKEADPEASIASWALRFVMSRPRVQVVLSGMSDLEQVEDNLHTFSEKACLTEEEETLVKKASDEFRSKVAVGCTACHYCTPNCPIGLDIPKILSLYNDVKLVNEEWRATFADDLPEGKRPEDCIGCGACTGHCPQSLDVPAIMKEMAEIRKKFQ